GRQGTAHLEEHALRESTKARARQDPPRRQAARPIGPAGNTLKPPRRAEGIVSQAARRPDFGRRANIGRLTDVLSPAPKRLLARKNTHLDSGFGDRSRGMTVALSYDRPGDND